MIKEFRIQLEELEEDITVTYSESEQDYVVRFPEALSAHQLFYVVSEIQRIIPLSGA